MEAQASLCQGAWPCWVVLPTESVWMLLVWQPSQLQLS